MGNLVIFGGVFRPPLAIFGLLIVLFCMPAAVTTADDDNPPARVPLDFGIHEVDLNADGVLDRLIVAWRETFNGDGHRILYGMIRSTPRILFSESRAAAREAREPVLQDVWDAVMRRDPGSGRDTPFIAEEESGNCALRRVALFTTAEGAVLVIAEKRDFASLFDIKPISIDFYTLVENQAEAPGTSRYAFVRQRQIETATGYCDAGIALDEVLATLD